MPTKPLHYYVSQEEPIFEELTTRYGAHLEKMDSDQKVALASVALTSLLSEPFVFDTAFYQQVQQLSEQSKLDLVQALVEQLRHL